MAFLALPGCFGDIDKAELVHHAGAQLMVDGSGVRGGEAGIGEYGPLGLGVDVGVFGEGLFRTNLGDPSRRGAGGLAFQLAWSPLSANADDHRLEHWVDLGIEVGGGAGLAHTSRIEGFGRGTVGAWLELGAGRRRGPIVRVDLQRVTYAPYQTTYDTATVLSIGLSWSARRPFDGNDMFGAWL